MNLKPFAVSAREAIAVASKKIVGMRSTATVTSRRGKDFSTDADTASQAVIKSILIGNHSETAFYGEEADETPTDPRRGLVWIVDPIDGTHNYKKGCGPFGISIALLENGVPILGTIGFPHEKTLYQGCNEGRRGFDLQRPSEEDALAQSTVWTDWSKQSVELTVAILERLREYSVYPTMPMCATHGLMMVATGKIEGYVHPYLAIEDHAAAGFLVQCVGGKVTDIHGNPWTPFSDSIMATNGKIHEELLDTISDIV